MLTSFLLLFLAIEQPILAQADAKPHDQLPFGQLSPSLANGSRRRPLSTGSGKNPKVAAMVRCHHGQPIDSSVVSVITGNH